MRVFLDTNVLLDFVGQRAPFFAASEELVVRCDLLGIGLFVAPHSLATIFYLIERQAGRSAAWSAIRRILDGATVARLGDAEAHAALGFGVNDYEDALQMAAAQACSADWLITRDPRGFPGSPVPILSPDEFLQRFPAP